MPAVVKSSNEYRKNFAENPLYVDVLVSKCAQPTHESVAVTLDLLRACGRDDPSAFVRDQDSDCSFVSLALLSRMLHAESRPAERTTDEAFVSPRGRSEAADKSEILSAGVEGTAGTAVPSCLHLMVHCCGETPLELPTLSVLSQLLCKYEMEFNAEKDIDEGKVPQRVHDDKTGQVTESPLKELPGNKSEGPAEVLVQMVEDSTNEVAYSSLVSKEQVRAASEREALRNSSQAEKQNLSAARPLSNVSNMSACIRGAYAERFMKRLYFSGPIIVNPFRKLRPSPTKVKSDCAKNEEVFRKEKRMKSSYQDPAQIASYQGLQSQGDSMCSARSHNADVGEAPKFVGYAHDSSQQEMHRHSSRERGNQLSVSRSFSGFEVIESPNPSRCYCDFIRSPPRGVPASPHREESHAPSSRGKGHSNDALFTPPPRISSTLLRHRPQLRTMKLGDQRQCRPYYEQELKSSPREKKKLHYSNRPVNGLHVRDANVTSACAETNKLDSLPTAGNSVRRAQNVRNGSANRKQVPSRHSASSSAKDDTTNLMIQGKSIYIPVRGPPASVIKSLRRV